MTSRADQVKLLLLDMVAGHPDRAPRFLEAMTATEWQRLQEMAARHRLSAMLHHAGQTRGEHWPVPADVRAGWAKGYRTALHRMLRSQATLLRIDTVLREHGMRYVALKGSWLAWHAYPDPALRPMRDIDILVPEGQARAAFDLLIAQGFERFADELAPIESDEKHLPTLRHPGINIAVEVHRRLENDARGDTILSDADAVIASAVVRPVGARPVSYPDPAITLLHLIIHALYSHRFDNGPLTLTDISAMVRNCSIDWPQFWTMAAGGGWTNGCHFVLDAVEHWVGNLPIERPDGARVPTPDHLCAQAGLMMLQGEDQHGAVHAWTNYLAKASARDFVGKVRRWFRRTEDSRVVWDHSHHDHGERAPTSLYQRFVSRGMAVTGALTDREVRNDVRRGLAIERWLRDGAEGH